MGQPTDDDCGSFFDVKVTDNHYYFLFVTDLINNKYEINLVVTKMKGKPIFEKQFNRKGNYDEQSEKEEIYDEEEMEEA